MTTDAAPLARSSAWALGLLLGLGCVAAVAHTEATRTVRVVAPDVGPGAQAPAPTAGLVPAARPRRRVVVVRRSRAS